MRSIAQWFGTLALLVCCGACPAAVIVDFGTASMSVDSPGYDEDGYNLNPTLDGLAVIADQGFVDGLASTSNRVFVLPGGLISGATLTKTGPGPVAFNLISLKVGNIPGSSFPPIGLISATGNFSGGGSISSTFDASGSGLALWNLSGFTNLASVVFSAAQANDTLAIDDIFVDLFSAPAAVPEPASAVFLGLGSMALVVRRLRRRTSVVA